MAFLKGNCTKGDDCAFPHISEEAVAGIKKALDAQKKKDANQAKQEEPKQDNQ